MLGNKPHEIEIDRSSAIEKAIRKSKDKDVIFISGRGNRKIMCDTKDTVKYHLDKEVVETIITKLNNEEEQ